MNRRIFLGLIALAMSCQIATAQKSIVILYENDAHCGIDGYTKMAGLRDAINSSDTAYAAAVCCGDFLQGNTTGAISKGQYIADILRLMDYHALTLGNHEFDYGVPRMRKLLEDAGTPVTCVNLYEAGEPEPMYAPYIIHQYGDKKIAYIGACTPETMILEGYSFYDTNGILLYDLKPKTFYALVQQAVDAARAEGADYVILLSHVGETPQSMGFSSYRLVNNTRGIDIVLDGHSHEVIEGAKVKNLDGKEIIVTQTGTQFAHVGKLLITPDGHLSTQLIKRQDIPYENAKVTATVDSIHQKVKAVTSEVVAHSDYRLVVSDENDQWVVRGEETNAGDLVADAYRYALKADIGFENGGGIRNDIQAGDITYGDIIGMLPYHHGERRAAAADADTLHGARPPARRQFPTVLRPALHHPQQEPHRQRHRDPARGWQLCPHRYEAYLQRGTDGLQPRGRRFLRLFQEVRRTSGEFTALLRSTGRLHEECPWR